MAKFEIQGPDGNTYQVEAPDMQSAVAALQSVTAPSAGGVSADRKATRELGSRLSAFGEALPDGMSFGFFDNIDGAVDATTGMISGDGLSWGERYAQNRDQRRDAQAEAQEAHPGVYAAGEITGGMVPSAAAGAAVGPGATMKGTIARMLALGGVEGGIIGAGQADGQDVLGEAAKGAGVGAAVGGAAVPVVAGLRALSRAAIDPIAGAVDAMTGRASPRRANNVVQRSLDRSGKSQDDIVRALMDAQADGQPMYRVADAMGPAGQGTLSGIARTPGAGSTEIREFLQSRQANAGDRMSQFIADGFDAPDTAAQRTAQLTADRKDAADVAYDAARGNASPVDVRGALGVIDTRLAPYEGSGVVGDGIDKTFEQYRNRLAADMVPSDVDAIELSDFDRVLGIKQDLMDDIQAAQRAGQGNRARELNRVHAELDKALEAASPDYRAANDGYRDASRVIKAVGEGESMAAPRQRQTDTVEAFGRMTPEQQDAARVGYADTLISRSEAQRSGANRAGPLQTDKVQAEIAAMAADPDQLQRRIAREDTMFETRNRAMMGSRTADNQQDIDDVMPFDAGLVANLLSGNWKAAGTQAAQTGADALRGRNEATQQLIARMLLSDDPQKALAPVIRQASRSESINRVLEALMRQGAAAALN